VRPTAALASDVRVQVFLVHSCVYWMVFG